MADGLHGRKREAGGGGRSEKAVLRDRERIANYQQLCATARDLHKAGNVSKEALNATTAILSINPDFYSMWNYRRTIISAEWSTMSSEDRKALANGELKLTQELVRTHPKSYWLWNHRQWTLDHMDDPDWMRELKLCQMMLDLDARNFHGWDYRRYVVNKAGLGSSRSEFDYTTSKIEQSFSNYSAWHYRSKLIPRVMKAAEEREGQVTKDFHLVRNAFFTDPSDQSAWFYHRWLLGEQPLPTQMLWAKAVETNSTHRTLIFSFSRPVRCREVEAKVLLNDTPSPFSFLPVANSGWSHFVFASIAVEPTSDVAGSRITAEISVDCQGGGQLKAVAVSEPSSRQQQRAGLLDVTNMAGPEGKQEWNTALQPDDVWRSELKHVEELVEIEPDSKWALLTVVHLLNHLGENTSRIHELLQKLTEIDPDRSNFYSDYDSDVRLKAELRTTTAATSAASAASSLTLSSKALSRVSDSHRFAAETVDLGSNRLRRVPVFAAVRVLNLDSNAISEISGLEWMPALTELSVRFNQIASSTAGLEGLRRAPATLKRLALEGNPVLDDNAEEAIGRVKALAPQVEDIQ